MWAQFSTIFFLILLGSSLSAFDFTLSTPHVILLDQATGDTLFERQADERVYPASTIKILTAHLILQEWGDQLDQEVVATATALEALSPEQKRKGSSHISPWVLETGSSHIGIKRGERLTLETLLYGLLLESGNDAANVLAEAFSGSIKEFVDEMNRQAGEWGCMDSHFTNPSGLHHPNHWTTARDLGKISCRALSSPSFCRIVSSLTWPRPPTNLQEASLFAQKNRLLKKGTFYLKEAIGVKTGYTRDARHCLVAAAQNEEGRLVVAVLLGAKTSHILFREARQLLEAGLNEPLASRRLFPAGPVPYSLPLGQGLSLQAALATPLDYHFYPSVARRVKTRAIWNQLSLPIESGALIGKLLVEDEGGREITSLPLFALHSVSKPWIEKKISLWILGLLSFGALSAMILGPKLLAKV